MKKSIAFADHVNDRGAIIAPCGVKYEVTVFKVLTDDGARCVKQFDTYKQAVDFLQSIRYNNYWEVIQ